MMTVKHKNITNFHSVLRRASSIFSFWSKAIFGLGILIGFAYVFQSGAIVEQGYKMENTKREIKILNTGNQDLKVKISGNNSFTHLSDVMAVLDLVPANNISYIIDSSGRGTLAEKSRMLF